MKKTVVVNNVEKLKKIVKIYDIIGIGSEFCHNISMKLFDEIDSELEKILKNKKIIIYTPILTDLIFDNFVNKLKKILYKFRDVEVMLTDFGLLEYLDHKFPNIKKGISRPLSIDFVRMNLKNINKFLNEWHINSIETDEVDFVEKFKKRDFKLYLRIPLKYVAASRFCPYERKITYSCNYKCLGFYDELQIKNCNEKLILFENCYFKKMKITNYKKLDFDMIIETIYE
jgi:hypothetical protein